MSTDNFINEEFLQRLLGYKIKSYTCNVGTKPGDNYLSTIYSVKVVLRDDSLKSILVKCYPLQIAKREFLDNTSIFSTEYLIYDKFLPALNQLVDTCGDEKSTFAVNVASLYGGNVIGIKSTRFDAEPWISENFIVLEDLRTKGYKMLDRRKGLDLDHVLLTIKQLANLHALSWVYKQRNGLHLLVNKYPYLKDVMYKKENEAGWKPVLEGFNRNALEIIQQEFGPESDIFLKLKALLSKDVMDMIRIYLNATGIDELEAESLLRIKPDGPIPFADDQWLVATHGDSWINNLLFAYNEEGTPQSVVIVDHQTFRETCLTVDLAYLIYSSTQVSLRKQAVPVLLRTYFDQFVEICKKLNEKPPVSFTFPNFERRWRRARIYGLLMSINFITFIHKPEEPEHNQSSSNSNPNDGNIQEAYASVVEGTKDNHEWRHAMIEMIKAEYDDGIL